MCIKTSTFPSCHHPPSRSTFSDDLFPSQEARPPGVHTVRCAAKRSDRNLNCVTRDIISRSTEPCEDCYHKIHVEHFGGRSNSINDFLQPPPYQMMSNMFTHVPPRPGGDRLAFGGHDYGYSSSNHQQQYATANTLFMHHPQPPPQQPYNNQPSVSGLFSTLRPQQPPPHNPFFQQAPPQQLHNPFTIDLQADAAFAAMQAQGQQGESSQHAQQNSYFSFSYPPPQANANTFQPQDGAPFANGNGNGSGSGTLDNGDVEAARELFERFSRPF